jgi:hypothetical protein
MANFNFKLDKNYLVVFVSSAIVVACLILYFFRSYWWPFGPAPNTTPTGISNRFEDTLEKIKEENAKTGYQPPTEEEMNEVLSLREMENKKTRYAPPSKEELESILQQMKKLNNN